MAEKTKANKTACREEDIGVNIKAAKAKKAATATEKAAILGAAAKKAADVKVSEEKAAVNADIVRQRKEAEKQDKIDIKKRKAQASLEA